MRRIAFLLAIFFITGCERAGTPPSTPIPENYVLTVVAETMAALPSPTLAEATSLPTLAPTSTPSPSPISATSISATALPEAPRPAIQILSPGEMSKVVSPIILRGYVHPGAKGMIQIELLGEDGRLLFRKTLYRESLSSKGAYISLEIPFETRAAAEIGRVQISTKDKFGRPLEAKSIHLLLLSMGKNDINPSDSVYARAVFFSPDPEEEIYGGILSIAGEMQSYNDNIVVLELLDEKGKTLGTRTLLLTAGSREYFETTIRYKVREQVEARLLIRQADENFEGRVYIHSQIVMLNP